MNNGRRLSIIAEWTAAAFFVLCLTNTAGCNRAPEGPQTFPVQGKVEFTRGGTVKKLWDRQAFLQFQSVDQPEVFAIGEINEDGTFKLNAMKGSEGWEGAIAGKYRGKVNVDDENLVARKFLDYKSSGIAITVPPEQEIVIKIHK